jgi:MFS family permease
MADVVGRRFSFNATLFIGGVFGIAAGGAPSFTALGGMLAALGFGIGGSLPVDGMLFLEFIPGSHQYLLTFLSVFWAFGQLLASLVAWPLIANFSCNGSNSAPAEAGPCDVALNMGWRYTFYTLGGFTMVSWIARFFIFRLPESPKYLLFHGRDAEAIEVLRDIAGRCHKTIPEDVLSLSILRSVAGEDTTVTEEDTIVKKRKGLGGMVDDAKALPGNLSKALGGKTKHEGGFLAHFKPLFATKKLAWQSSNLIFIWGLIGLAYPLYNAFLPSYLAERNGVGGSSGTDATYRDYAIISTCGIPGSILAAWFVELPRSGRKGALAVSTLITGVFVFALTGAPNNAAYLALNCIAACFQVSALWPALS